MPRIHAGLGGDVDESEACVVILGRVGIHAKTNLANLRLRRQLAAAKTVHADLCAWSGELVDGVLEFVRVVGELCDLFGSQDVAERWSIRVGVAYLRFFGDVDVNFDDVDLERHFAPLWTGGQIEVSEIESFEASGLDVNLITARSEFIETCLAALVSCAKRLRFPVPEQLHLRLADQRAARIFHDHFQAGTALSQARRDREEQGDEHTYRPRLERLTSQA